MDLLGVELSFEKMLDILQGLTTYILFFVFSCGIYLVFLRGSKEQIEKILKNYIDAPQEEDKLFLKTGIKITANRYSFYLYMISLILFTLFGAAAIATSDIRKIVAGLFVAIFIIFTLRPKAYLIGTLPSPFVAIIDLISAGRQKSLDQELFNTVAMMKNIAIAQEKDPLSADLILEKLMENSKKLRPIFAQMITIYRQGDKKRALEYFSESIGTRNARSFALTLEKLDVINPTELKMQVITLQEVMAEQRFTLGMQKAESKGNFIYLMATIACFVCLLNFIFVCVLSDTMDMLDDIF